MQVFDSLPVQARPTYHTQVHFTFITALEATRPLSMPTSNRASPLISFSLIIFPRRPATYFISYASPNAVKQYQYAEILHHKVTIHYFIVRISSKYQRPADPTGKAKRVDR